jgi:Reverse transcriptase (RNA-dependent DNA polymerase)
MEWSIFPLVRPFPALNGVKQGAIISPILFCVHLDTLLLELKKAGQRRQVWHWFAAALAYADDVVLLAPTARAMRSMLSICDRFASDFDVTFNGNKSKCIMFKACNRCAVGDNIALVPHFLLAGHAIENVLTWPRLGHILSANLLDDDILAPRNRFIGQTNNLLC